ncbi:trypsin-like serine protease [Pararhizobium sp. DWP3-4]|uniref:trypsin-like serine protease n=1 Tax=Pararhizobium sp. DWP3-4 TaxID=2804565 RepID=UPI003CEE328A
MNIFLTICNYIKYYKFSKLKLLFATMVIISVGVAHATSRPPEPLFLQQYKSFTNVLIGGDDLFLDTRGNATNFVALVEAEHDSGLGTSYCTGVAVASDVVLTAGHCLRDVHSVRVKIVSAEEPMDYETVLARSTRMHSMTNGGHPGEMYSKFSEDRVSDYHDIGVIILEYPSIFAVPIKIVPFDFNVEDIEDPHLFIFGRTRDARHVDTGRISFVRISPPAPFRGGKNYYKTPLDLTSNGIQAVCKGDSGGPVTVSAKNASGDYNHYLMGIFVMQIRPVLPRDLDGALSVFNDKSLIPQCGTAAAYVNIQSEVSWIESVLVEMDPLNVRKLDVFGR